MQGVPAQESNQTCFDPSQTFTLRSWFDCARGNHGRTPNRRGFMKANRLLGCSIVASALCGCVSPSQMLVGPQGNTVRCAGQRLRPGRRTLGGAFRRELRHRLQKRGVLTERGSGLHRNSIFKCCAGFSHRIGCDAELTGRGRGRFNRRPSDQSEWSARSRPRGGANHDVREGRPKRHTDSASKRCRASFYAGEGRFRESHDVRR